MPNSAARLQLEAAIKAENLEAALRRKRSEVIAKQLKLHQQGMGPAPTDEELEQWRKDMDANINVKFLHSGLF